MNRILAAAVLRPNTAVLGLSLGLSFLAAGAGCAHAAEPHSWYVSGAVTGSALDEPHQTIANAPTPGSTLQVVNAVDFGWGGQGAIGYQWRFLRIEAEIGHTGNHSSRYSAVSPIVVTLPQSGENTITRYMANAYLEPWRGRWPVSPYLGVGVGAADARATTFAAPARAPQAPPSQLLDIKDTRAAYQVMGGVSIPVTARLALTAQYRWLDVGTVHGVDSRNQPATRTLQGGDVDVGLRLSF